MKCYQICEHNAWGSSPACMKPDILACPMGNTVKDTQEAKADAGKLQIHMVPMRIVRDIAEVRMYGTKKYGDENNWKKVEAERYRDALMRHLLLEELVRREVRQEEQAHEDDKADDEQLAIGKQHGAVGLDDGDEQRCRQGIGEHELVENLCIGSSEHAALTCRISQRHDDEDGKDVFD